MITDNDFMNYFGYNLNSLFGGEQHTTQKDIMRRFGYNLKTLLEESYMTQKELADDTGISESMISRYINGLSMPSLVNIINISYSLGCSYDDLITVRGRVK